MKKSAVLTGLLLAAATSLAFYRAADTPPRHLLLIVRYECNPSSGGVSAATISTLEGESTKQRIQGIGVRGTRNAQLTTLHQAEVLKLDSLVADGWSLHHTWANQTITGLVETTHLLTRTN